MNTNTVRSDFKTLANFRAAIRASRLSDISLHFTETPCVLEFRAKVKTVYQYLANPGVIVLSMDSGENSFAETI